jgi:iron complex transport system ATP-binding protein
VSASSPLAFCGPLGPARRSASSVPEPPLIEFERVSVVRGGREVLSDFSLVVRAPQHVAIVGPNGAGKSTLLKLISRECYPVPRSDTVCRIMGRERWNVFELRGGLGLVSNDLAGFLDPTARAEDVVLSGFFSSASLEAFHSVTPAMRAAAAGAMEQLGIAHLAVRPLRELSSGEARRAAIARALVNAPRALIFDEPLTALDLAGRRDVSQAMRALARRGVAIVLVTHELHEVIPEIERVVFIKNGRVHADGPKAAMFTGPRLADLFGISLEVEQRDGYYFAR